MSSARWSACVFPSRRRQTSPPIISLPSPSPRPYLVRVRSFGLPVSVFAVSHNRLFCIPSYPLVPPSALVIS